MFLEDRVGHSDSPVYYFGCSSAFKINWLCLPFTSSFSDWWLIEMLVFHPSVTVKG